MVHASTHMESFSMCGWASSPRYRATQYHHVPFYLPPPDLHHLPDALRVSRQSQGTPFPYDHDSPRNSLACPGAPEPLLAPSPQGENESQKSESRNNNNNKALAKGSPFCPRDDIPQGWLSSRVIPPLSPPVPSFPPLCACWHQGGLDKRPSPF